MRPFPSRHLQIIKQAPAKCLQNVTNRESLFTLAQFLACLLKNNCVLELLVCSNSGGSAAAQFTSRNVTRFYQVYDAARGQPTAVGLQQGYLDGGSEGLRGFIPHRIVSANNLAQQVRRQPAFYVDARGCLPVMDAMQARLPADERFAALIAHELVPTQAGRPGLLVRLPDREGLLRAHAGQGSRRGAFAGRDRRQGAAARQRLVGGRPQAVPSIAAIACGATGLLKQ